MKPGQELETIYSPSTDNRSQWKHQKARDQMVKIAVSMIGHHYLRGGKGARPGVDDGAKIRPAMVNLEKDKITPIYFAATANMADGRGKKVCAGRYERIGQAIRGLGNPEITRYLSTQDPTHPAGCSTMAGLTPRRIAVGNEGFEALVWGECCDGWRHFDCIGLIDFSLETVAAGEGAFRSVEQWASKGNTCGATRVPADEPSMNADLVSNLSAAGQWHIGILYVQDGKTLVVQAEDTSIGVTVGKLYEEKKWNGGRWRMPDSMFKPDGQVPSLLPDSDCKPKSGIV